MLSEVNELLDELIIDEGFDENEKEVLKQEAEKRFIARNPGVERGAFREVLAKALNEGQEFNAEEMTTQKTLDEELDEIEDQVQAMLAEQEKHPIVYDTVIAKKESDKLKTIPWKDIDFIYDFRKGFIEFIKNQEYVHLYFDFDSIKSEEELLDVFKWADSLQVTFGKYSVGGYTKLTAISEKFGLKLIPNAKKDLSIHIVFYDTCIAAKELVEIMKHTKNKGFATKGIHSLCDPAPYKLNGRQAYRHVLSDKIFNINNPANEHIAGSIMNGLRPSTQIIQIRGTEDKVTRKEWEKHFQLNDREEAKAIIKEAQSHDDINDFSGITNLNYSEKLIILSEEELGKLLDEFPCEFTEFESIMTNIIHSPYDKEVIERVLSAWYNKRNHHNGFPQSYINSYYEKVDSNKWFYSIIKHLPDDKKNSWIDEVRYQSIDETAEIDMADPFCIGDIRERDYRLKDTIGINVNKFLTDLKRCVVFTNISKLTYIVKEYDAIDGCNTLAFLKDEDFKKLMKSINLGKYYKDGKTKNVNAWMIYDEGKNKNWFKKDGMKFFSTNPRIFSFFKGYNQKLLETIDMDKIKPYLSHIKEVISSDNEEFYEYVLNWFAYIIQNPGKKTETALVLTGEEGTGKNVFTNVLCKLIEPYSNRNVTNIDNIVGKFNASLENKILIVCNELSSAESNKYLNSDALKTVITENRIDINQKNMPVRTVENVTNLIFLSNNFDPVKITKNDRRYVINETSNKYKGLFGYFDKLCKGFDETFYDNLYTFFKTRDLSKFNPRNIPVTKAKENILEFTKSSYELFYERFYNRFCEGWICSRCYERYRSFAQENGFAVCSNVTFGKNMIRFVEHKKKKLDGKAVWIYSAKLEIKQDNLDELEEFVEVDENY